MAWEYVYDGKHSACSNKARKKSVQGDGDWDNRNTDQSARCSLQESNGPIQWAWAISRNGRVETCRYQSLSRINSSPPWTSSFVPPQRNIWSRLFPVRMVAKRNESQGGTLEPRWCQPSDCAMLQGRASLAVITKNQVGTTSFSLPLLPSILPPVGDAGTC